MMGSATSHDHGYDTYLSPEASPRLWDGTLLSRLKTPWHDLSERTRPFPVQCNYFHSAASEESGRWLRQAVALEPEVYDRLLREDIGGFSSWVYPDATAGQVRAVSDFHQWVVGLDDLMDRRSTLDTSLSACTTLESLGTVELAPFDDIFTRMRALDMTDRCAEQFLKAMHLYGESSRHEVKAYAGQTGFASLRDYVDNRRSSAAMPVYFALIKWISRIDLPDDVYQHPVVKRLENACSDYAMLYNDAGSFIKEYLAGRSEGTFVRLLSEQHGLSVQDTLYEIADMAAAAADDLEAASDRIEACDLPAHQREHIHRYADGLRKYTGGVNHWSNHTCRYLVGQPLAKMPPTSDKGDIHHLRDHAG